MANATQSTMYQSADLIGGDCYPVADSDQLGDGVCDGFIFNTQICGFDGGDCLDFNIQHPKCCGTENYTILELFNEYHRHPYFGLGDGKCDGISMYSGPECGYDGGDCELCYTIFEKQFEKESFGDTFGDGKCDGSSALNIDICGFDGGDCYFCMEEEKDDSLFNASRLGDGICDGGSYMTEMCNFDGGDCDNFLFYYPDCDAMDPTKVGDGTCNSEYNIWECGFDGGDCQEYRESFNLLDCHVEDIHRIGDGVCDWWRIWWRRLLIRQEVIVTIVKEILNGLEMELVMVRHI